MDKDWVGNQSRQTPVEARPRTSTHQDRKPAREDWGVLGEQWYIRDVLSPPLPPNRDVSEGRSRPHKPRTKCPVALRRRPFPTVPKAGNTPLERFQGASDTSKPVPEGPTPPRTVLEP